ncbi:hypothetical protein B0H12DRAFT_1122523 [Mycena haematopus]|nr:hypothetical protein B0H12DRAFT_1122523 [Mycena haematopus]
MGLRLRVEALVQGKTDEDTAKVREAGRRLVDQARMGSQYQVMGIGGGRCRVAFGRACRTSVEPSQSEP